ncbi:MAG: CarD family transcriptional regulator [Polyangiales bacterium]
MTFIVGDKAVYPGRGVGEITAIEQRALGGSNKDFYILRMNAGKTDPNAKVMVATDAVERVGLRQVISKTDANRVMKELKKDEVAVTSQPWNRRFREYTDMLHSGSPIKVAKVLRDLSRVRQEKGELSYGERQLMDKAKSLLVTEIALAKQASEEKVAEDIDTILA